MSNVVITICSRYYIQKACAVLTVIPCLSIKLPMTEAENQYSNIDAVSAAQFITSSHELYGAELVIHVPP